MEVTTNSLVDLVKVQPSSGKKIQNAMGASSEDNEFRHLIEAQQSTDQNELSSNQKTDSTTAAGSPNGLPNNEQLDSDDFELNKQMLLAAMMLGQTPKIVQPDMQEPIQEDVGAANVEGVSELLVPQTSDVAQQLPEEPQLAADVLPAEGEVPEKPVEMQTTSELKQPVAAKEQASEPLKPMNDRPETFAPAAKSLDADLQKDTVVIHQNPNAEVPLFHKVDTVPIRVGDTFTVEKNSDAEVPTQIAKQLAEPIQGKVSSIELELNPRSLGHVHVEMKWLEDGSLHVTMKADKLGTQAILERSAGALQGLLEHDAQQPVRVNVQQPQEDGQPNHNNHGNQQQEQQQSSQHSRDREQQDTDSRFLQELRLGLTPINYS